MKNVPGEAGPTGLVNIRNLVPICPKTFRKKGPVGLRIVPEGEYDDVSRRTFRKAGPTSPMNDSGNGSETGVQNVPEDASVRSEDEKSSGMRVRPVR